MEVTTGAMGSLLPKLGQLLLDEYKLHKNVKKDISFLQRELESMQAALAKVGEVPREQLDKQVKLWAGEVRELYYIMEDAVDIFLVRPEPHASTNGFKRIVKKMAGLFKKGKNHHRIASAVKEIKEQLHEVSARRDRNKVDGIVANLPAVKSIVANLPDAETIDPRLQAIYVDAAKLVGIYGKRDQELMRLLSNLSELRFRVKGVQQEDMQILGGLPALCCVEILSTHQIQRRLVISADGYRRVVRFELECRSGAQILFEPGALPRVETVGFSVGVRVVKDDGNGNFDLGLQGNLLSLKTVLVVIYPGGAMVGEAKEAEVAVRRALLDHPNSPEVWIKMWPEIPEDAHDDDLCDDYKGN